VYIFYINNYKSDINVYILHVKHLHSNLSLYINDNYDKIYIPKDRTENSESSVLKMLS